jgi:hypothetical protein
METSKKSSISSRIILLNLLIVIMFGGIIPRNPAFRMIFTVKIAVNFRQFQSIRWFGGLEQTLNSPYKGPLNSSDCDKFEKLTYGIEYLSEEGMILP